MIKNQWYAILPSKKVSPDQIVAVKRMNLDIVLFRNRKNEIGCCASAFCTPKHNW